MRTKVTSVGLDGSTNLAVMAPIRPGFVDGFETVTYLERLHKLLSGLLLSRQAQREATQIPIVFPDSIGRFRIIRDFRYAIFPAYPPDPANPAAVDSTAPHWLTLNVTFDGGWEPYMRVIYRDIGSLLDALFVNCVGYPGSRVATYDEYCRWVRLNELPNGMFYTASSTTSDDARYLGEVDRIHREEKRAAQRERRIAALALPSDVQRDARARDEALGGKNMLATTLQALRQLKGLYRLSPYYPPNAAREDRVLVRFAQRVLIDFGKVLPTLAARAQQATPADPAGLLLKAMFDSFADELAWFGQDTDVGTTPAGPAFDPSRLQAGIVEGYDGITHGCMVMLRVVEPNAAVAYLQGFRVSRPGRQGKGKGKGGGIFRNIALSHGGMRVLGIDPQRLDKLPPEFAQGMEARAGLLGDVHANHPDRWQRPRCNWADGRPAADGERLDLSVVDVVIVLRLGDAQNPSHELHPRLVRAVQAIERAAKRSLAVLRVEPLRSYPSGRDGMPREHFGFLDGFSQPRPVAPLADAPGTDEVWAGDIALGYRNGRGDDGATQAGEDLLRDGSFLVVRKLQQDVPALNTALDAASGHDTKHKRELLERMVGRRVSGVPLVPGGKASSNAFDYDADPKGSACPFHAHVRRTNPRDGRPAMPRIMRRGMSYGPRWNGRPDDTHERGLVFMAYCGSISEQFEVVQGWAAGANSSGVGAGQSDPLLGVPMPGTGRSLRSLRPDGSVERVDLGDKPFVTLQWGLYLFALSPAALRQLPDLRAPAAAKPPAQPGPSAQALPQTLDEWRRHLEDPELSVPTWREVRRQGGNAGLVTPYGRLIGTEAGVRDALVRSGTPSRSVCGYGERLSRSIGLGYLGLDDPAHAAAAEGVNDAITLFDIDRTFGPARGTAQAVIAGFVQLAQADPSGGRVPIDLMSFAERVLAALCTLWFGLPDGKSMVAGGRVPGAVTPPRCPGHLLTTSRYVFSPRPADTVVDEGQQQGAQVLQAFQRLLDRPEPNLGELGSCIQVAIQANAAIPPHQKREATARTLAGVMMGFPPTVYGNFLRLMSAWQSDKTNGLLWELQRRLGAAKQAHPDARERAIAVLHDVVLKTMALSPLPEVIWRTDQAVPASDRQRPEGAATVVLGLASALATPGADPMLMFGGAYGQAPHACPGYGMAMGVLLGMSSALLEAGTLRATGSPISLMLIP